jgi:DNA-binding FadR family transcriptional regulator
MTAARANSSVVRVPKAGEMIAAHLRRQIILGELAEGEALPSENALMVQFGVSRPTLREAFRILEAESIITVRRGAHGGARVLAPDGAVAARYTGLLLQHRGALLADVYSSRAVLEVSAVGLLAARRGTGHLTELRELLEQGVQLLGNGVGFAQHDAHFHQTVVRLTDNATLTVLIEMLYHIIAAHNQRFLVNHALTHGDPQARAAQRAHEKLVTLLEARDGEAAQKFWRRHLDLVAKYMITDPATTVVEVLS